MAQQIKITQTSNADMNIGVTKKITAIEWLVEQYANENYSIEVYERAKQMEKEQIMKAASVVLWINSSNSIEAAEQYYNETYGENKD